MSYVTLDSPSVRRWCENTLRQIREEREELKATMIARARRSLFNRLRERLGFKPLTDEQVYEGLTFGQHLECDLTYGHTETVALRLLNASQHAMEINVSIADLERIT